MPQRKCAAKSLRADKKRRLHNVKIKNDLKQSLKKFQRLIAAKNIDEAKKSLIECSSKLDKAARKGLIAKSFANHKKAQIAKALNKSSK